MKVWNVFDLTLIVSIGGGVKIHPQLFFTANCFAATHIDKIFHDFIYTYIPEKINMKIIKLLSAADQHGDKLSFEMI